MSNSQWDKGFVSGAKAERERILCLIESSTYDKIDTEGNIHKAWRITPEEFMKHLNGENK